MNVISHKVSPIKRIAASIYDFFLLLGIWFGVGSLGLWLNDGVVLNQWLGLFLVFISTWAFYCYFWTHGNKTLGMAVWKIEIYSLDGKNPNIKQASIRFLANMIVVFLAGIPLLQIYFSAEGKSISDSLSKTGLRFI
tara:strand:- start:124 stop:534 length:411 start_codon:yes stop_codon:yes gene_type:complete